MKVSEVAELLGAESWFHHPPNILNQGRVSHYVDPSLEGEEKETKLADLAGSDPIIDRLKSIA